MKKFFLYLYFLAISMVALTGGSVNDELALSMDIVMNHLGLMLNGVKELPCCVYDDYPDGLF